MQTQAHLIRVYSTGKNTMNLLVYLFAMLTTWSGDVMKTLEISVTDNLRNTFMFGLEETKAFMYQVILV